MAQGGEPIIISGGSVTIEFSDDMTSRPTPVGKKYKDDNSKLVSVLVNGQRVAELQQTDVVTIETEGIT